ncbi:MAG: ABC-F family ATP-binding cassette domain-containing protein [Actinomycetota bacterium]
MLAASGLAVAHGSRTLFSDLSIRLLPSQRTALVGGNGVGKTTLLEILVGLNEPDAGEVHRPKDLRVGYLPQDLETEVEGTVLEEAISGADHLTELAKRLHHLEGRLGDVDADDHERVLAQYGEARSRFEQLGGYALEAEAHSILSGLGFSAESHDQPVKELSGGWRMRVALARLLLSEPDVLVLDEPTNHLDVDSVAWLEQHLATWPGALLFVSHDRDFIDAVATRIIELDRGRATEYAGAFAEYVVAREARIAELEAAARQQARKIAQTERFVERFRYKATKARQVQSRIKTLEKLERIEVPTRQELLARFAFPKPQRSSRIIAELEGVSVGYDGTDIVAGVDLVVERGHKIGFVGPNGAGKTTLIRLITGELAETAGTVTRGSNVDVAVFSQRQTENLDLGLTVLEEFKRKVGERDGRNLRTVLGAFGFRGDAADRHIAELSGGERTRLALAETMADPVNLLVLDEPTNHLDLPSCDLLEDALIAYPGTVLIVSHDRHLIRSVADSLVAVRDGRAEWHDGVDEQILSPHSAPTPEPEPARPSRQPKKPTQEPTPKQQGGAKKSADRKAQQQRARELRKQLAKAERDWERAEAEVAELQATLADPDTYEDPSKVADLTTRYDSAKDRAAELMEAWETVMRRLERAEQGSGAAAS